MIYSIHPKIYRLQHEIDTLKKHMRNAQQGMGMTNPAILRNYRDMIHAREDLISMMQNRHHKPPILRDVIG